MNSNCDPITQEIIQNSLTAIAEEMFVGMAKTAMSSVIYEVLDFGVAITDAEGNLASAGAGIPSFVGMLDPGVKAIIRKYKERNDVNPGDIFITNDPYEGGVSHANDVVLVMPIFVDGKILAWTANKGHWIDIGGATPGSISPVAVELFQEGLQLPEVRLFSRGEPVESIFDIIRANIRLPDQSMGDLWAGIAALRIGEKRLKELTNKYGFAIVIDAIKNYLDYGESVVLRGLQKLPKGTFKAEDQMDDGRILKVAVTITNSEFIVDLKGNPPQDNGPMNGTYFSTLMSAQAIFKGVTAPQRWANAGSFRPIKLLTDEGSLFHAKKPAAVGLYYENKIRSADLIWKALAPEMPDLTTAGHFCSICATVIGLNKPDGTKSSFIEPEVGGWGAGRGKDGENAQFSSSHGETFNCPVEVNEARNGIFVDCYQLNNEPTGAGEFRGGKGIELRYRVPDGDGWLTAGYSRTHVPPWGQNGGNDGSVNKLVVYLEDGTEKHMSQASQLPLKKDDVVCIITGNGAGYGDSHKREKAKILDDLKNQYITKEEAIQNYALNPSELEKLGEH